MRSPDIMQQARQRPRRRREPAELSRELVLEDGISWELG